MYTAGSGAAWHHPKIETIRHNHKATRRSLQKTWDFQQDNDPKHIARAQGQIRKKIKIYRWTTCSKQHICIQSVFIILLLHSCLTPICSLITVDEKPNIEILRCFDTRAPMLAEPTRIAVSGGPQLPGFSHRFSIFILMLWVCERSRGNTFTPQPVPLETSHHKKAKPGSRRIHVSWCRIESLKEEMLKVTQHLMGQICTHNRY